ncbi:MAG: hypothetical protein H6737_13310 [Alphaproteobacteria bacterium]|nr:hypothetical protein [Alphaproteobacteria bacterium]
MHTRFLMLSLVACGGSTPTTPLPGGSANYTGALGDDPDFSAPHSRIAARIYPSEAFGELSGAFADGPPLRYHVEAARSGSCRVMEYTPSTCDPACTPGTEACIDGTCVPWPARTPRGAVTWTHPAGSTTVQPDGTNGYYATASVTALGPMTLDVEGTVLEVPEAPELEPDGDWAEALGNRGTGPGLLEWTNPMPGARVRLWMSDCTASHGGIAAAEIECEGPDTGSLEIPAAFLDQLAAGDWSHGECGSHVFERYHAAAPDDDAGLRFESKSFGGLFFRPDFF